MKCKYCEAELDDNEIEEDCWNNPAKSKSASVTGYAAKVALLDMFKDHYWDSLEKDRDIVLKHVESVLDMYEF